MNRFFIAVILTLGTIGCERKAGRIGEIPFAVNPEAALAQAKAQGKPLFLEFWGDT